MNICFFGSYDPEYTRNKILLDGLKKNRIKVYHCRSIFPHFFQRYSDLLKKYLAIYKQVDLIYVAFMGHLDMPLAWILAKLTRKKIVFDMFYSMYDTYIYDRESTSAHSLRGTSYHFIDKISAILADIVVFDTISHRNYILNLLSLPIKKGRRVLVGGDENIFRNIKKRNSDKKIIIEFHGMFTRLQGAEYFIQAAKILEKYKNLEFLLIGSGSNRQKTYEYLNRLQPSNITYFPVMPLAELAKYVGQSTITVGHLGNTKKAQVVISNKTYQGLFCKNAVIAGNTPANKELFKNRKQVLFTRMANANDLAEKIMILVKNKKLRTEIAEGGYTFARTHLTNSLIGKELLQICKGVLLSD